MSRSNERSNHTPVSSPDENRGAAVDLLKEPQAGPPGQLAEGQEVDDHEGDAPQKPTSPLWRWALVVVVVLAVAVSVPYYFYARGHTSTDDAFIDGHVVPISPRVSGHVAKVYVTDNQWVNAGDLLVEIDPRDFEAKLAGATATLQAAHAVAESRVIGVELTQITSSAGVEESSAALAAAKAAVETARAAVTAAESQRTEAEAELASAQAALKQAEADVNAADARHDAAQTHLKRVGNLAPHHAVSEDSLDEARAAERVAQAAANAAREQVKAGEAVVKQAQAAVVAATSALEQAQAGVAARQAEQSRVAAQLSAAKSAPQQIAQSKSQQKVAEAEANHAQADVEQARLDLSYTKVYAPVSGHVTRKSIEPGAFVHAGQNLFAIVEPEVWVVANFKETQLTKMRPGQSVTVEVDTYPGTRFAAHVDSIQRGSGARFSLMPPENATGNFVKVVQRVPVKIVFDDPAQLERYTLGPGMSVEPTVDLRSGDSQATVAVPTPRTAALE